MRMLIYYRVHTGDPWILGEFESKEKAYQKLGSAIKLRSHHTTLGRPKRPTTKVSVDRDLLQRLQERGTTVNAVLKAFLQRSEAKAHCRTRNGAGRRCILANGHELACKF